MSRSIELMPALMREMPSSGVNEERQGAQGRQISATTIPDLAGGWRQKVYPEPGTRPGASSGEVGRGKWLGAHEYNVAGMISRGAVLTLALLLTPYDVRAQSPEPTPQPPSAVSPSGISTALRGLDVDPGIFLRNQTPVVAPQDSRRACDGCPPRRLGKAFLQATYINVVYELANLARGQVTARITPATWWTNLKRGWEWDLDDFVVNQIGHPYQGNNYFTAGRANGLDFWESSALTAFGSGTWEYLGETNQASLNDFINTTLGGIALGEMFHRAAWLVRDTRTTESRRKREIIATVIDPMTGLNRFMSGDASRVTEKPPEMVPSSLNAITSVGYLGRGSNTDATDFSNFGFLEVESPLRGLDDRPQPHAVRRVRGAPGLWRG